MPIPLDPGAGDQSIGAGLLNMTDIIVSTTNAAAARGGHSFEQRRRR
jgi:hypothetical protein